MFKGVFPATPTPFFANEISCDKLAENLRKWNTTRLAGYLILGSNGEFFHLSESERLKILMAARDNIPADKKMIAGTGCLSTDETIRFTNKAAEIGANAALVITPFYFKGKMTSEALIEHFNRVADASKIPILLYNVPRFTGIDLEPETVHHLSGHPNIVGIKDSSGNIGKLTEIIEGVQARFSVLIGAASVFYAGLSLGGHGAVVAVANVAPNECTALYNFYEERKFEEATKLQMRILPINRAVTTQFGVGGLKAAMDMLGYFGGEPRLPLQSPSFAEREEIKKTLIEARLLASAQIPIEL